MQKMQQYQNDDDQPSSEDAYDVPEAGRRLGIGRNLAYALVRSGEIPSIRLGARRIVVPRHALDAMLRGERKVGDDAR